jgi:hypothetical protein
MVPPLTRINWRTLVALLAVASGGCQTTGDKTAKILSPAGPSAALSRSTDGPQRVEIIYAAHSAHGALFVAKPVTQEIIPVSTQSLGGTKVDWAVAELVIRYPHPKGHEGQAEVSLRLKPVCCGEQCCEKSFGDRHKDRMDAMRERREQRHERFFGESNETDAAIVSTIDVPQSELAELLSNLTRKGYFEPAPARTDGPAQLEVRIDGRWRQRQWAYEPELDELVSRAAMQAKAP